jgi:hypothetical protein
MAVLSASAFASGEKTGTLGDFDTGIGVPESSARSFAYVRMYGLPDGASAIVVKV